VLGANSEQATANRCRQRGESVACFHAADRHGSGNGACCLAVIGIGYSATTPPAIKWFPPSKKGLITDVVVSGVGLAAVYISPPASAPTASPERAAS